MGLTHPTVKSGQPLPCCPPTCQRVYRILQSEQVLDGLDQLDRLAVSRNLNQLRKSRRTKRRLAPDEKRCLLCSTPSRILFISGLCYLGAQCRPSMGTIHVHSGIAIRPQLSSLTHELAARPTPVTQASAVEKCVTHAMHQEHWTQNSCQCLSATLRCGFRS